eukprot:m.25829 g.25829  ORF g.25829 m.25829 type:complete len:1985 (-) comp9214_c0_seq1:83-6037(-)
MTSQQAELDLLDRVLLRIASANTDNETEKQLNALLCPIILKFTSPHPAVKAKLMELLRHINEILQSRPQLQLPLEKLIVQYTSSEVDAKLKTFTSIYIRKGMERLTRESAVVHIKQLFLHAKDCGDAALPYRYGVPLLPDIVTNKNDLHEIGCGAEGEEGDAVRTLLHFVSDFLRFQTAATQPTLPPEGTTALPPAPSGLSRNGLKSLVIDSNKMYQHATREAVMEWKKKMLSLLSKNNLFPHTDAVLCVLTAAGDANTDISEFALNTLRRMNVDVDDKVVIDFLTSTVIQSPSSPAQKSLHPDDRRTAASVRSRVLCMSRLLRSKAVYSDVGVCVKCVFSAINANQGSSKLICSGLDMLKQMLHFSPSKPMEALCPLLLNLLIKTIEDPSHNDDVHARAFHNLGLVARHNSVIASKVGKDFNLLRNLFVLSAKAEEKLSIHVQDALNLLRDCYRDHGDAVHDKIVTLLLEFITHSRASVRSVALKYAMCVFPGNNVRARFVVLLACGDAQHDIKEEANTWLQMRKVKVSKETPSTNAINNTTTPSTSTTTTTTTSTSSTAKAVDEDNGDDMYNDTETIVTTSSSTNAATDSADAVDVEDIPSYVELMCLLGTKLLHNDLLQDSVDTTSGVSIVHTDTPQLSSYKPDVVRAALLFAWRCAHLTATHSRTAKEYSERVGSEKRRASLLREFLLSTDVAVTPSPPLPQHSLTHKDATQIICELCVCVLRASNGDALHIAALDVLSELLDCIPDMITPLLQQHIHKLTASLHAPNYDIRTSTAKVLGCYAVLSDDEERSQMIKYILENITDTSDVVSLSRSIGCCTVSKYLFSFLPCTTTHFAMNVQPLFEKFNALLAHKRDDVVSAACDAVEGILLAQTSLVLDESVWTSLVTSLVSLSKTKTQTTKGISVSSSSVPENAVAALGKAARVLAAEAHASLQQQCLLAIYNTARARLFEMNLTAGDALTIALAPQTSLIAHNYVKEEVFEHLLFSGDDHQQGGDEQSKRPKIKDSLADGLDFILQMRCTSVKAAERHAAAVWIVAICKHCAASSALQQRLPVVQEKLLDILSEGDDIMQEVASHGLELCYALGGEEMKKTLVDSLTHTLAGGHRSKSHKFTADSDDVVFEGNALGKTKEGGHLNTYKELTALAADLNQPDLIYQFMSLANHNLLWNSRRGAAYGFGRLLRNTNISTDSHMFNDIIPKLYRYKFDPNPRTRSAMNNIWNTVVKDGVKEIDRHFDAIVKDLLQNVSARQWRVRESSAQALAEVLRGRTWRELKHSFLDIWKMSFRVIDDVKETVRTAGVELCKRLLKLSTTLCSKADSGPKVIAELLPFITEQGLVSKVKEVNSVSLAMIIAITKDAGAALKPHLTTLILTLLEALSGLESPYLDYIGQRLSATEGMEEHLDNARMAASKTSPIAQCLNECILQMDAAILPEFIPRFISTCKTSLGASTKAGCARITTELVRICGNELTPFAKDLLKSMLSSATSKSAPVRRDFANAVGTLFTVASPKDISSILKRIKKYYYGTEDESATLERKEASALSCRSIALRAPDVFAQQLKTFIPLSFFGKHDDSSILRGLWSEVWAEAAHGTVKTTVRVFAKEILLVLRPRLRDRLWTVKQQASKSLSEAMKYCDGKDVQDMEGLIADVLECLSGRTWTGKEQAVQACCDLVVKYRSVVRDGRQEEGNSAGKDVIAYEQTLEKCADAILKEASKRDREYKVKVLPSLAVIAGVLESDSHVEKTIEIIVSLLKKYSRSSEAEEDGDEGEEKAEGNNGGESEEEDEQIGLGSSRDDAEARRARSKRMQLREDIESGAVDVFKQLVHHSRTFKACYEPLLALLGTALLDGVNKVKVSVCRAAREAFEYCGSNPKSIEDEEKEADERANEDNDAVLTTLFSHCLSGINRFGLRTSHSTVRQGIVSMCVSFATCVSTADTDAVLETGIESGRTATDILQQVSAELKTDTVVAVKNAAVELEDAMTSAE